MTILSDSLSAALLHSLWQDAIAGILLWLMLAALRHRSATLGMRSAAQRLR